MQRICYTRSGLLNTMKKDNHRRENTEKGFVLFHDDTPPEEEIIWTEEELKASEERTKILIEKFKHHFE